MPHIHEKIDFTVEVFIVHDSKVLLRKHDKHKKWLSIGGHIELEHDPIETAHKEVKEEVGLEIELFSGYQSVHNFSDGTTAILPPRFMNRHRINETHEHVTFVYFATTKDPNVIIPTDSHEAVVDEDWNWFSLEEIQDLEDCPENIKYYASVAIKEISL